MLCVLTWHGMAWGVESSLQPQLEHFLQELGYIACVLHRSPCAVLEMVSGTAGCALSYIQANSSYSMFAQILYATPSSANLSGTPPSPVT